MTNKYLTALVLSAGLLSGASVSAGQFYIGAGASAGSGEEELESSSYPVVYTFDYSFSQKAIKGGYQFDNSNRFELSFSSINIEFDDYEDSEESYSGWDLDYFWAWGEEFRPYLMLGIGFYSYDDTAQYFADNTDLSGVSLNLGGGVIWQMIEHVDVELGYKMKFIGWEDYQSPDSYTTYSSSSSQGGPEIAVHFLF